MNQVDIDHKAMRVKLWDLGPDAETDPEGAEKFQGPLQIEMWSLDARDALTRDPARYVLKLPKNKKPGPAHEEMLRRKEAEEADMLAARRSDPVFGGLYQ